MANKSNQLTTGDLDQIHAASMRVMREVGVGFPHQEALDIFEENGFKVEGEVVFFNEDQLMPLLEAVPSSFTLHARNPERSVEVGAGKPVLAPGYGAPFLADPDEGVRKPTVEDYRDLVRLAHMLPNQDLSGYLLVQPDDVEADVAHLRMIEAHLLLSDKPFIGCTEGEQGVRHTLELASIVFDQEFEQFSVEPIFTGLINPLSPLRFSQEMIAALISFARHRQPAIIATAAMAGSTAPITLAAVLVQQNAEVLAGIALAQLVSQGTPVVYGSTSSNMDMRTGAMAIGGPELSLIISATGQMAEYYNLPSRSGGALSDSYTTDARAGYESSFSLLTAINSDLDLIIHSGGILGSYLVFSREKFILDDDLCGMALSYRDGITVDETHLALGSIMEVGHEGNFLKDPLTVARCRTEFWKPSTYSRDSVQDWIAEGRKDAMTLAGERWRSMLDSYEVPEVDPALETRVEKYIEEKISQ